MNEAAAVAVREIADAEQAMAAAVSALVAAMTDTEPVPHSIVLLQTREGKVHRAARIADRPGYMTYEADNLDSAVLLHDLSAVPDDADLCDRCFGPVDPGVENV